MQNPGSEANSCLAASSPPSVLADPAPTIGRLVLTEFRSYPSLDLRVAAPVIALTGENGAGKTNILEALSLLTPGKGLRRADFVEMVREDGPGTFAIAAEITGGTTQGLWLGTGLAESGSSQRQYRIDRQPAGSVREFADHVRVVWLTPAMDGLFAGAPGERRRYLDRLVLAVDAAHAQRTNALERALRNRNKLLEMGTRDSAWLDAAEREVAELAIAVGAARSETVDRLSGLINAGRDETSPFPWAELTLQGEFDAMVASRSALDAETRYRDILREQRPLDAAAGRSLYGPQASDLKVRHGPKQLAAAKASTGEQKALLVGLTLAHATLVRSMTGIAPLVLLDEVAAHFDVPRRAALFERIARLGSQVWMTSADPAAFAEIHQLSEIYTISPGKAARI